LTLRYVRYINYRKLEQSHNKFNKGGFYNV